MNYLYTVFTIFSLCFSLLSLHSLHPILCKEFSLLTKQGKQRILCLLPSIAAMSLEMENVTWNCLGCCSFCFKIFHSNVTCESPVEDRVIRVLDTPDNSKRSEEYSPIFFLPPIITTPFSVGEEIIVDPCRAIGSLGPIKF